jgi:regulator of sirC expression with transglutaminase-like and TPR domain
MNLLCAEGLPGAERVDIEACLVTLDRWAEKVRFETERHLYRAHDPRWAEHYRHSESCLRAEFLLQVLQEDCGVHYNLTRVRNPDFTDSRDLFIHGLIDCDNGGTCVSMPVLYVAVGRRLGYPLKLVLTKRHVFCRWETTDERFNVDPSGNGGIGFQDDDYYRTWPATIDEAAVVRGEYLKPLTPAEELAVFLAARGHCLYDTGRVAEARDAYAAACRLMPQSRDNQSFLEDVEARLAAYGQERRRQVIGRQRSGCGTRP